MRYWWHSEAVRHAAIARSNAKLIEHCVSEHRALAEAAGAIGLLRQDGWISIFRTRVKQDEALRAAEQYYREFGVGCEALDPTYLQALEPDLNPAGVVGALRYTTADSRIRSSTRKRSYLPTHATSRRWAAASSSPMRPRSGRNGA